MVLKFWTFTKYIPNVRVDNENSVALFKRVGFEITGLKQDWIYDHGKFYDEYTMQYIKKS